MCEAVLAMLELLDFQVDFPGDPELTLALVCEGDDGLHFVVR